MRIVPKSAQSGARSGAGIAILAVSGLLLGACTNTNQGGTLPPAPAATTPTPLSPVPTSPVEGTELRPTSPEIVEPTQPETPVEVASVDPSAGQPVTRDALIGAWTVSTGGSSCQIFLALTKWSGGYRAASRGCSAPAISDVQAWDVKGKQVVLVDSSGSTAATLIRSGDTSYNGSTSGGGAISFTR